MEPLVLFTYFCIAMTQLWIATDCTNEKFRMVMYSLWFLGTTLGFTLTVFK